MMIPARAVQLSLVIFITAFAGYFYISNRGPEADENLYINYAYSLYKHDVFGLTGQDDIIPEPSARVAPLLPLFISILMHLDDDLAKTIECYVTNSKNKCENNFITIKYAELGLLAVGMGIVWLLILIISKSQLFSSFTIIFILLSGSPYYFIDYFLTESIYFPIGCVFILCYSLALVNRNKYAFIISSILIAILALLRPSFYYLFYILILFTTMYVFLYYKNMILRNKSLIILSFLIPFVLIVSPWLARNYYFFDKMSLTIGYGAQALSSRLAYNRMTDSEYLYGWIYWLPDFGDSLAIKIFGKDNVKRLDMSDDKGFLRYERKLIRNEIQKETGFKVNETTIYNNITPERWLINNYILGDLYQHIKVTILLAWRAVFVEKYFGLIGLFFMVWAFINGLRNYIGTHFYLISLSPVVLLFFHAFISFSIPRYNILLILPMSVAMTAALMSFYFLIKRKLKTNLVKHVI